MRILLSRAAEIRSVQDHHIGRRSEGDPGLDGSPKVTRSPVGRNQSKVLSVRGVRPSGDVGDQFGSRETKEVGSPNFQKEILIGSRSHTRAIDRPGAAV